jgi:cytochrome c peroxidase
LPPHFALIPAPQIPKDNPLTVEGVELGKKLYYEKKLSKGGPLEGMACASCHLQSKSFYSNLPINMEVIPHFNMAWSNQFLWEGKVQGNLEDVMLFEVNGFFQSDLSAIRSDPNYPNLFRNAFDNDSINSKNTAYALAQFLRTLISSNSRYDNYLKKIWGATVEGASLDTQEIRGMEIYLDEGKGDCFHCHGGLDNPLLTNNAYVNNGLDAQPDSGLAKHTKISNDLGKFKTPTLRNLVFTAPYMHDGRFSTLEDVVDFYADQVVLSSQNIDGNMLKLRSMSPQERSDLVAFLKAITDSSFTENPAFRP